MSIQKDDHIASLTAELKRAQVALVQCMKTAHAECVVT